MTKATGRGRGWRRKGQWNLLAKSTQQKYRRKGIDAGRYQRGASLGAFDKFVRDQSRYYGRDPDEVREELKDYDAGAVFDAISLQQEIQKAFLSGDVEAARRLWETRDQTLPDWMFYYHGAFS